MNDRIFFGDLTQLTKLYFTWITSELCWNVSIFVLCVLNFLICNVFSLLISEYSYKKINLIKTITFQWKHYILMLWLALLNATDRDGWEKAGSMESLATWNNSLYYSIINIIRPLLLDSAFLYCFLHPHYCLHGY